MNMNDLTGQLIKDYHLFKMIGKGGFGAIYQAQHIQTHEIVAVKTLHKHLLEDNDVVERFQREARSLAALHHPNIVQLIDFDWDDSVGHFMVLEWLPGRSLKAYLKEQKRLSLTETYSIMEQLLAGLGDAHAQGIVHRDLKPGNIFLVPYEHGLMVKILDFGLALLSFEMMRRTRKGAVMGSSNYMSPEQSMGKIEELDIRTDIYACGCLLSKCLTGHTPLRGNAYDIAMKHYHKEPFPLLRELYPRGAFPESLEQVYLKTISRNKDERYGSCWELYQALQEAIQPSLQGHGVSQDNMMQTFVATNPSDFMQAMAADSAGFLEDMSLSQGGTSDSSSLEFELDSALGYSPSQSSSYHSQSEDVMSLSLGSQASVHAWSDSQSEHSYSQSQHSQSGHSHANEAFAQTSVFADDPSSSTSGFAETHVFDGDPRAIDVGKNEQQGLAFDATGVLSPELLKSPNAAVARLSSPDLPPVRVHDMSSVRSPQSSASLSSVHGSSSSLSSVRGSSASLPGASDEDSSSISIRSQRSSPRQNRNGVKMRGARLEPESKPVLLWVGLGVSGLVSLTGLLWWLKVL
jgi:serine/threonine protein kinase